MSEDFLAPPKKKNELFKKIQFTEDNYRQAEVMSMWGMNVTDIGILLGCSKSTVDRHMKEDTQLRESIQKGRAKASADLTRIAHKVALDGNIPMIIFLLKTRLGYREEKYVHHTMDMDNGDESQDRLVIEFGTRNKKIEQKE